MAENSGIEYTGERMIPGKSGDESECEHLARYHFAIPLVTGLRTLDAGSGEGYGSALLADSASEVIGIDISAEAISSASSGYTRPGLEFRQMDVKNLEFEPGSFDAAVCFEVFEHITEPEKLLDGLKRILKPNGILIISTPNGAMIKSGIPNPHHVKEYTLDEFNGILSNTFTTDLYNYERFGQFNMRRREGFTTDAIGGLVKLKRKLGIGKLLPDTVNKRIKDSGTEPYTVDDFEFLSEEIEKAEYFVFVIRGIG